MRRKNGLKQAAGILLTVLIMTVIISIPGAADEPDRKNDISYLLDGVSPQQPGTLEEPTVPEQAEEQDITVDKGTYTVKNLHIPEGAAYYNGHYYYYYDDPVIPWNMAFLICYNYHAHLVSVTSADEQAFLERQYPGTRGWIGASLEEDGWKWMSSESFEYTNWKEGAPKNQNNGGYAYLSPNMQWDDLPKDDTAYHSGFYCEWDSDIVSYKKNGLLDGEVSEEVKQLVEEGKGYYYGIGPEGYDFDEAWECFKEATDGGSGEAWYYMGLILEGELIQTNDPYIRAMGSFDRAVTYGFPMGWYGMGCLYEAGLGVPEDYDKAMQMYKWAVDLGCEEANYGIALLYNYGHGVEQDYDKAFKYFLKAAEAGYPYAMYSVGKMYENGQGTPEDYSQAKLWYERLLDCKYADLELKESVGEEQAIA